jgi:hypothetical protein
MWAISNRVRYVLAFRLAFMIVMPECLLANRTLQVVFRGQQLGQIKLKHDLADEGL